MGKLASNVGSSGNKMLPTGSQELWSMQVMQVPVVEARRVPGAYVRCLGAPVKPV
jgi:hypothetical protein